MTRYLLKTVRPGGGSHGGFMWPLQEGATVTAPDWTDTRSCGGGLHGLLNGAGDGGLLDWSPEAVWLVAEIPSDATVVDLSGKVKVESCTVVHVGDRQTAPQFLVERGCVGVVAGTATAGDGGTATAGDGGTATAGDGGTATAGLWGTATAGDEGVLIISWWDPDASKTRRTVGVVGEDGIEPNVTYRCNDAGQLVKADS